MSTYTKNSEEPKYAEIGRLLSCRLHEAREKGGWVICPMCRLKFEATHLIKCPQCRTLIGETFEGISPPPPLNIQATKPQHGKKTAKNVMRGERQLFSTTEAARTQKHSGENVHPEKRSRKTRRRSRKTFENLQLELDFFPQRRMEYEG